MIPRKLFGLLLFTCVHVTIHCQGERTYDTSDWIPITPSASDTVEVKAPNARALNLEIPSQNYFPSYDYRKQKSYLDHRPPRKHKQSFDYKLETPPPPHSKNQINYYSNEPPYTFEQSRHRNVAVPSVNPQAPAPDAKSIYEQYQLPFNTSFYQSLNPLSINNDLYKSIVNTTPPNYQQVYNVQPNPPVSNPSPIPTRSVSSEQKQPVEQESVQLLYVPVENLNHNQPATLDTITNYHKVDAPKRESIPLPTDDSLFNYTPLDQPRHEKLVYNPPSQDFYYPPLEYPRQEKLVAQPQSQTRLEGIEQDLLNQALQAHKLQEQFRDDINPLKQEVAATTTEKPKRKAHQPPLAVFMESRQKAEVSDVLNLLRGAKTIAVQDAITPNSPRIFIGPSNLDSPLGYAKFSLPYLNNINGNRIERKIEQLPFFVAPVSYKAPPGYTKISLPSPHVGSVVVSVPASITTTPEPEYFNPYTFNPTTHYNPVQQSRTSRPQQNILLDNSREIYQSTATPPVSVTRTPITSPNIYENTYTPSPDLYYKEQPIPNRQTYRDDIASLDLYKPEQPKSGTPVTPTTPPNQADLAPIDLAINEFELRQINNDFGEHPKVKHSTTTTRPEQHRQQQATAASRGRYSYDFTTEKPVSRGRTRSRGKGTKSTTTTTTYAPIETERYTVLEEFNAKEAPQTPVTESYKSSTPKAETDSSRRSSTTFTGSPYLPDAYESFKSQIGDDSSSTLQFETPKENVKQPSYLDSLGSLSSQQIKPSYLGNTDIENIPTSVYSLGQYDSSDFGGPTLTPTKYNFDDNVKTTKPEVSSFTTTDDSSHVHRFRPEIVSYENREPNQGRTTPSPKYQTYEVNIHDEQQSPFQPPSYERPPAKQQTVEETKSSEEAPPGFIDNLFQPNFDQTYISLQDQAVRSLLVPNLLPVSDKTVLPTARSEIEEVRPTTAPLVEIPSSTEQEVSTSTRATRTRGRGRPRGSSSTVVSSTPSSETASKRTPNRRRPITRTSTERISPSTEYSSREDSGGSGSHVQQRFRTRGRPLANEITDRVSTTENDVKSVNEGITHNEAPQSYMQFEHTIDEQQIMTINPLQAELNTINPQYNFAQSTTEPAPLDYESKRNKQAPIVDVQVQHVVPDETPRRQESTTKRVDDEIYVRYNNGNIKSGGVLNNRREPSTTTVAPTRTRGRTRGRSRFATSTTTYKPSARVTARPTSAPSSRTIAKNKDAEEEEFYGFTRQPNYSPATVNIQAARTTPRSDESVRFVGEIRPKYTPQPSSEESPETPRPRIRARTRAPTRKTTSKETDLGSRSTEQVTRRSGATPLRTRGRGHYKAPENVKRESEDEDVANQNYPVNFLQKLDASTPSSNFQIAMADDTEDQASHYSPKFLPLNSLSSQEKSTEFVPGEFTGFDSIEEARRSEETVSSTTPAETSEAANKKKGVWKLKTLKRRPADPLEVSESQNFQSVLNAFESIQKVDPYTKSTSDFRKTVVVEEAAEDLITTIPPASQESIFDAIFGMFEDEKKNHTDITTTSPIFPEEITEQFSTSTEESTSELPEVEEIESTTESVSLDDSKLFTKPYEVEPWDMKQVKTSTSTEVSHETEICYKGRCVKSRDRKKLA